ncbi:MAG: response regulator [Acidobacteriota bacterium]
MSETKPRPRVLLVDDYPDALEIWTLYLELSGYEVLTADNGRDAVTKAITGRPDIIVMDLELPGISGFEAAKQIRENTEMSEVPLIAATGYSHARQLDEARASGFDLIMIKPCDPAHLAAEIDRLLNASSATRFDRHIDSASK